MKAQRLPSGAYRVRVTIDGRRESITAPTADEAIYEAMALKTKHKNKKSNVTFGGALDDYIQSKQNILSPSTIDSYRRYGKHSLAELRDISLSELTPITIQKHFNLLAMKKSPKTVQNAHGLLVSVLNVYEPELAMRLKTTLPKKQKRIKQLPDVQKILTAIIGSDIELPCLLAIWCSLRMSEIRGAKKSDVKDGILTIHSTILTVDGKNIERDMTKTIESTRQIRLPQRVQALITALPQEQEYLTTLSGQALYKRFVRLLARKGIEDKMTFHDLRHLNASVMLALGIPDKYAMERGGWSTPHVMKSVYQHTFSTEREKIDNRIDAYFENLLDTKMDT